jgi:Na+/H+-dicarboxylate symporter
MIAVPLIVVSLIVGLADLDISKSKLGSRTVFFTYVQQL